MKKTISVKKRATVDVSVNVIQCVEDTSRFMVFHRGLTEVELGDEPSVTPLSAVSVATSSGDPYKSASVSDDGKFALLIGDEALQLWDLTTHTIVAALKSKLVLRAAFLRSSHQAIVRLVRIKKDLQFGPFLLHRYDADLRKLPTKGHTSWSLGTSSKEFAELPGAERILLVGSSFESGVYSIESGECVFAFSNAEALANATGAHPMSFDVNAVLTCDVAEVCVLSHGPRHDSISVWETRTGKLLHHHPWAWDTLHGRVLGSLHRDGKLLGLTGDHGSKLDDPKRVVRVVDLEANSVARTWVVGDRIKTLSMLPDGLHALTSGDRDLRIWRIDHDEPVAVVNVSANVVAWALSAQGILAVATDDDQLHAFTIKGYSAPIGTDSRRAENEM